MKKFMIQGGILQKAHLELAQWEKEKVTGKIEFSWVIENGRLRPAGVFFCRLIIKDTKVEDKKDRQSQFGRLLSNF